MSRKARIAVFVGAGLFVVALAAGGGLAYSRGYYHAMRGGMIEDENPRGALVFFRRAYEMNPDAYMVAHDIACCHARLGERDEAIAWLKTALGCTYGEYARTWARTEKDFTSLRGDPEFERLLAGDGPKAR
jgi:tetratricopeptide (TPR) repeat protein